MIDGYNLLHVTGIFGRGRGAGGFERARNALINFVVASLSEKEIAQSVIVFDANDAPPGLPRKFKHEGLTVRFASGYESADAMIEELIEKHHAPRQLTVVSSDHRIQRAARRRKATAIDSEVWYAETLDRKRESTDQAQTPIAKPTGKPTTKEVEYWLAEFGDCEPLVSNKRTAGKSNEESTAKEKQQSPKEPPEDPPELDELRNPFPPGYGEDLL